MTMEEARKLLIDFADTVPIVHTNDHRTITTYLNNPNLTIKFDYDYKRKFLTVLEKPIYSLN